jgi:hypothetical protein
MGVVLGRDRTALINIAADLTRLIVGSCDWVWCSMAFLCPFFWFSRQIVTASAVKRISNSIVWEDYPCALLCFWDVC